MFKMMSNASTVAHTTASNNNGMTLLVKRRIGMSVQQLSGVELSTFRVAKNTQGWFIN
jgi:hypothetical protein